MPLPGRTDGFCARILLLCKTQRPTDSINGLLIHSAQHGGKQSVLYASGTNGHRLRSTMSLLSGGVVASFSKPAWRFHLLDVHPWTSVTMDSAMSMVQELGRASSFFAKKLPKNVIFAGHLADNAPTVQKRQRGFLRTFSKPSEDQFKPLAKAGLRDCANKFSAPLLATNRGSTSEQTQSQPFSGPARMPTQICANSMYSSTTKY